MSPNWFQQLLGFKEESGEQVRDNVVLSKSTLTSKVNGASYEWGWLELPSLEELRTRANASSPGKVNLTLDEIVADVQELHKDPQNAGALFQVASQFNLLEMVSPDVTPERGVSNYENDRTQGPACAVACGAGTIYRNYFVELNGQLGQTADRQVDGLAELGDALHAEMSASLLRKRSSTDSAAPHAGGARWQMKNGYALVTQAGLKEIATCLAGLSADRLDALRSRLRIGIQRDTQVTLAGCTHQVTQAYCSALPVAYCGHATKDWQPFARLILEAAYEATLCAALINAERTGNPHVYLTLLGGGAFGNEESWIMAAIERAVTRFAHADLKVHIVSFRRPNHRVQELVSAFAARS